MAKRILIECTPTYTTNFKTGIQRVVKAIVTTAKGNKSVEVLPVVVVSKSVYKLPDEDKLSELQKKNENGLVANFLRIKFFIFLKDWLRRYYGGVFSILRDRYFRSRAKALQIDTLEEVKICSDDIVLMLDAAWGRFELNQLKQQVIAADAKLVYVLYDLIPVLYPEYCNPSHTAEFERFISNHLLGEHNSGVIGISKSVIDDFHDYVQKKYSVESLPDTKYFHLGVDKKGFEKGEIRSNVKNVFANDYLTLLMVSTIEPRKNHEYVLNVFDKLWSEGRTVQFLIVGKIGWEVLDLMKRIEQHPKLGSLLHVYHDLNDAELVYCYKQSTALISPSHTEGFGLPIIEALEYSLPVIASDISVHREIGGDSVMYVKTDDVQNLFTLVQSILEKGIPEQYCQDKFTWLSWEDSAAQLIDATLELGTD